MSEPIIAATGLTKRFGAFTAVDDLTLTVEPGAIFAFLGANGSGKSTTIRMLIGLLEPTAGTIRVDGIDVIAHPRRVRERIGYMGQKVSLYQGITLRENVEFYAGLYGIEGTQLETRWGAVRERFALGDAEGERPESLPAGLRQRAGVQRDDEPDRDAEACRVDEEQAEGGRGVEATDPGRDHQHEPDLGEEEHQEVFGCEGEQRFVELDDGRHCGRQQQPGEHPEEGLGQERCLDLGTGPGADRARPAGIAGLPELVRLRLERHVVFSLRVAAPGRRAGVAARDSARSAARARTQMRSASRFR